MSRAWLLPMQQAALYEVLAQTPGPTVVPRVTNVMGVAGIGIRSDVADKGSIDTMIFDPRTYAPLGMNWTGVAAERFCWPSRSSTSLASGPHRPRCYRPKFVRPEPYKSGALSRRPGRD